MVHTQHKVVVEKGANLSLVQRYYTLNDSELLLTDMTQVCLQPSAKLHYVKSQKVNDQTLHCCRTFIEQAESSELHGFSINQGGAVAREQITPSLVGPRSVFTWSCLLMTKRQQRAAWYCEARHLCANARSNQVVKSIAREASQVVINGNIFVDETAGGLRLISKIKSFIK